MLYKDAINRVGEECRAWTACNGNYFGKLIEVKKSRPWRGVVQITGVIEPAQAWQIGQSRPRRGFRIGETIEVGGSSIRFNCEPTNQSYLMALKKDLAKLIVWYHHGNPQKDWWWILKSIPIRRKQIKNETNGT